jgi:hypothetical protein
MEKRSIDLPGTTSIMSLKVKTFVKKRIDGPPIIMRFLFCKLSRHQSKNANNLKTNRKEGIACKFVPRARRTGSKEG